MTSELELSHEAHAEEQFKRAMDEIEIMAAVLEDVEGDEVAGQITMWLDYMIYRALYGEADEAEPECSPEAREYRRLVIRHLDDVAWGK